MKNLPTKKELREKLEHVCEVMRDVGLEATRIVENFHVEENSMRVEIPTPIYTYCSPWHEYKPETKIPGDMVPVLGCNDPDDFERIVYTMSKGEVNEEGLLVCYYNFRFLTDKEDEFEHWYNLETGEHSPEFPVHLVPERFLKK